MKQRIEELKQQAGIDFNPDQEGLDLFAELIVKECMNVVDEHKAFSIKKDIKKHFGVEE